MKPFDERLFVLKLQEPSQWMQAETATRERQVDSEQRKLGQGFGAGWLAKRVDSAIAVLREYLPKVDQCCRETWLSDHEAISPEFIRRELVPRIFTVIAARKGTIQWELKRFADRTRIGGTRLTPALHHLVRQAAKLENGVATQYEIEAVEIAKRTQVRAGAEVPPPVRSLSGFTMAHSAGKPSQIPPDYRPYYPNELKAKTQVILAEAIRKFPEQTQALDLCKYVVSEMTSVFRAAVNSEIMRPDQVISDVGMGGLLHSLLVYNCERDNERYRLEQEVRRSDEWMELARETDATKPFDRTSENKPAVWTKLVRRGDFIVLAEQSNDTTTQMRHDYDLLYWNVRQFGQWVSQRAETKEQPTLEEAKVAFGGTILVGDANCVPYLTDQELEGLITHPQTPSTFAESIVAKRWGFRPTTGKTYLRRKPKRKSVKN